jgi:hypothetical protein
MAKPLPARAWIERTHAKGFTYRQIAEGLNRSVSTVARIRRGLVSGESVRPAAKALSRRPAPQRGATIVPPAMAPEPIRVTPRVEIFPAPSPEGGGVIERVRLSRTRSATIFDRLPTNAELMSELRGRSGKDVLLKITWKNGHESVIFGHGWNASKMAGVVENAESEWLESYLEREKGYKQTMRGGIESVQVVLY